MVANVPPAESTELCESQCEARGGVTLLRALIQTTLLLVCTSSSVLAQQRNVYVFGGGGGCVRQSAEFQGGLTSGSQRSMVPMLVAGAGGWIAPATAIEGSVWWHGGQTIPWHSGYLLGGEASDQETTDMDMPLIGSLRYALLARRRVGLDVLAGAGFSAHRAVSTVVADCGPAMSPHQCVPVAGSTVSYSKTSWEPLLSIGIDMPAMTGRQTALVSGVRVLFIHRNPDMTAYDFRGPQSGSGLVFSLSGTVSWRDR